MIFTRFGRCSFLVVDESDGILSVSFDESFLKQLGGYGLDIKVPIEQIRRVSCTSQTSRNASHYGNPAVYG